MTDPRSCPCSQLTGTGQWSLRRFPAPEIHFEAACAACGTVYWLSLPEAEKGIAPEIVAAGRAALAEMISRYAAPEEARARAARRRFEGLRPLRDALVLGLRRLRRALGR